MKIDWISKLFRQKTFLIIFSLAMAVICWATVVLTISSETTRVIEVPVTIDPSDSVFANLGLEIIDKKEIVVNVTVSGDRSVVGSLDSHSINVMPNLKSVGAAGVYEVPLTAQKNDLQNYSIVSLNPTRLTLRFDTVLSKKLTVMSEVVGLTAADDLVVEKTAISPSEVTITGPEQELAEVAEVVAVVEVNAKLSETFKKTVKLAARDKDGNIITSSAVRLDPEQVDITVPILKKGILPLGIDFSNVPDGFDTSTLKYNMSVDKIPIAASAAVIANIKTKTVGYIDLTTFKLGEAYTFDIPLSSGTVNLDNIKTVTVTFKGDDIDSKKVNVADIRVVNEPANYKVTVQTERINAVTVIGRAEDVADVLAGSVVAIVDMNVLGGIESGEFNVPVSFTVTSNSTTWVAGSYSVVVHVEPA
ncbi:MAG: CdaR family protein [Oscillospiraceae bacterium]